MPTLCTTRKLEYNFVYHDALSLTLQHLWILPWWVKQVFTNIKFYSPALALYSLAQYEIVLTRSMWLLIDFTIFDASNWFSLKLVCKGLYLNRIFQKAICIASKISVSFLFCVGFIKLGELAKTNWNQPSVTEYNWLNFSYVSHLQLAL